MLIVWGGLIITPTVHAETVAQFDITASIVPGCLVDGHGSSGNAGTIGSLDFGVAPALSTNRASAAVSQTIRLRCTPGVTLIMAIDGGQHAAGGSRNLQHDADAAARLAYSVCRDAACSQPIPIGGVTQVQISTANSQDVLLPVFGSLVLPGTLQPGTYSDRLTVTLTW